MGDGTLRWVMSTRAFARRRIELGIALSREREPLVSERSTARGRMRPLRGEKKRRGRSERLQSPCETRPTRQDPRDDRVTHLALTA